MPTVIHAFVPVTKAGNDTQCLIWRASTRGGIASKQRRDCDVVVIVCETGHYRVDNVRKAVVGGMLCERRIFRVVCEQWRGERRPAVERSRRAGTRIPINQTWTLPVVSLGKGETNATIVEFSVLLAPCIMVFERGHGMLIVQQINVRRAEVSWRSDTSREVLKRMKLAAYRQALMWVVGAVWIFVHNQVVLLLVSQLTAGSLSGLRLTL